MKIRKSKEHLGMTLIELLMGAALFGVVSLGGILLMTQKKKEEITGSTEVLAAETAEAFFKQRGKVFQTAFEDPDVNHQITFVGYNPRRPVAGTPALEYYSTIQIPSSGCFTSGDAKDNYPRGFVETIENVCLPESDEVAVRGNTNESGLSQPQRDLLDNCAVQVDGSVCPYHRMRVQVRREAQGENGAPNINTVTTFPLNNQQGIIGSAVCIQTNGQPVRRDTLGGNPYTGVNLGLHLIMRNPDGRLKIHRKEMSYARPRLKVEGSIIPDAIGCDKSQN